MLRLFSMILISLALVANAETLPLNAKYFAVSLVNPNQKSKNGTALANQKCFAYETDKTGDVVNFFEVKGDGPCAPSSGRQGKLLKQRATLGADLQGFTRLPGLDKWTDTDAVFIKLEKKKLKFVQFKQGTKEPIVATRDSDEEKIVLVDETALGKYRAKTADLQGEYDDLIRDQDKRSGKNLNEDEKKEMKISALKEELSEREDFIKDWAGISDVKYVARNNRENRDQVRTARAAPRPESTVAPSRDPELRVVDDSVSSGGPRAVNASHDIEGCKPHELEAEERPVYDKLYINDQFCDERVSCVSNLVTGVACKEGFGLQKCAEEFINLTTVDAKSGPHKRTFNRDFVSAQKSYLAYINAVRKCREDKCGAQAWKERTRALRDDWEGKARTLNDAYIRYEQAVKKINPSYVTTISKSNRVTDEKSLSRTNNFMDKYNLAVAYYTAHKTCQKTKSGMVAFTNPREVSELTSSRQTTTTPEGLR